jgi:predicted GNAT family acetyltransferase
MNKILNPLLHHCMTYVGPELRGSGAADDLFDTIRSFAAGESCAFLSWETIVAYDGNSAVGSGCYRVTEKEIIVEIKRMYVKEEVRGTGNHM